MRTPEQIIRDVKDLVAKKDALYQEFLGIHTLDVPLEEKIEMFKNIEERLDDLTTKLLVLKEESNEVAPHFRSNDLIH